MATKVKVPYYGVKTPYYGSFNIPYSCVACGDVPVQGMNWPVSGSKSNWNGKQTTTLSLKFPLCQECYTVSRDKGLAKFLTVIGVLGALGICILLPATLVGGFGGSSIFKNSWLSITIPLMLVIIWAALVGWLTNKINQKGFTPEQRERRRRVKRCAKILSFNSPSRSNINGSIVFRFVNPSFAREFSIKNSGLPEYLKN